MNLKVCISLIFTIVLYQGCGSSSNSEPIVVENDAEDYSNTQWYKTYNEEFYSANGISQNANITPDSIYTEYKGSGVKIAIIDDGFDTTHPELQNRIYKTINTTNFGLDNDVSHSSNEDYHGTAVAGIIAANDNGYGITGIAPKAELILIKMASFSTDLETIEMFQKAVDAGAWVINCSWGTGDVSDTVRSYINYIANTARDGKGVVVVFASGNGNHLMSNDESAIESVVGVGATDHNALRSTYSDYGPDLDVVAPGGGEYYGDYGISTIDPIGSLGISNNDYNLYSEVNNGFEVSFIGTSASAPIVSASIALMLEANPNLTREEIQYLLRETSDKIGMYLPYIENNIVINDSTPMFQGSLGSTNSTDFKLKLTLNNSNIYKLYTVSIDGNNWFVEIQEELEEGFYKAELLLSSDNQVLATDSLFEINHSKTALSYGSRNDFYGYGKINLAKLIEGSLKVQ